MSEKFFIDHVPNSDTVRFVDSRTGEIILSVETSYWVAQAILYGLNNYIPE
jgi:hypothetical protein